MSPLSTSAPLLISSDNDCKVYLSYSRGSTELCLTVKGSVYNRVKELHLYDCTLTKIPEWIERFKNVEVIDLSNNALHSLANRMEGLVHIRICSIAYNPIASLPKYVSLWSDLQSLDLSHTKIKTLPKKLAWCQFLSKLCMDGNELDRIPNVLSFLQNLKELGLSQNALKTLPTWISTISLRTLDISHNRFPSIPYYVKVGNHKTIEELNTEGNPIEMEVNS